MSSLDVQSLLQIALQLERRGAAFFNHWSREAETEDLRMFFKMLSDDEEEHIRDFMKISTELKEDDSEINVSRHFKEFYEMFSEKILFNDNEFESVKDLRDAIELSKKQEIDAQLFYSELKKHIDVKYTHIVDQIISEEATHYKKLSDLQKKLKT